MAEIPTPVVITAIADPEFEGFVASTLFGQGWSVIFRALDIESLEKFISEECATIAPLLITSPDLLGITPDRLAALEVKVSRVFSYLPTSGEGMGFRDLLPRPGSAHDLISLVRGNMRSPMIALGGKSRALPRRAKVIALASAGNSTGCTSIAINLAMELSLLEQKTLLIDSHTLSPAVAILLDQRNLHIHSTWKTIAPMLSACEVSRESVYAIHGALESAMNEFDYIIIDLGVIGDLAMVLSDRRWTSDIALWSCDQADELWITATPDLVGEQRLRTLTAHFEKMAIRAKLGFLLSKRAPGRKGEGEESKFLAIVTPLRPHSVMMMPLDERAILQAQAARATLSEVNERSPLRKAIAALAGELAS